MFIVENFTLVLLPDTYLHVHICCFTLLQLSEDDEWSISPESGQVAGGTEVIVHGLIPDTGVTVIVNGAADQAIQTEK